MGVQRRDTKSVTKTVTAEAVIAEIVLSTIISASTGYALWYISRLIANNIQNSSPFDSDPDVPKGSAVARLEKILQKHGRNVDKKNRLSLSSHESHIAEDAIDPDDIDTSFEDIGGLDKLKQEIWELAVLPLVRPDLFKGTSRLVQQPSGILLYGRPGTGKTMLAKAVAKESKAIFIPIKLSKILNKWMGESNKLVAATFSLATKLAPSIIFIDELDAFLSDTAADMSSHKSMDALKSEFLTLWDGITTDRKRAPVLVLGATNRPQLIDPAILRRMPRSFNVPLPQKEGRQQILNVLLKDQPMTCQDYIPQLAKKTVGYSGSDLKELCQAAAMEPVREVVAVLSRKAVSGDKTAVDQQGENTDEIRPVCQKDFEVALGKVKRTGQSARNYGNLAQQSDPLTGSLQVDEDTLKLMLEKANALLASQSNNQNGSSATGETNSNDDGDDEIPDL